MPDESFLAFVVGVCFGIFVVLPMRLIIWVVACAFGLIKVVWDTLVFVLKRTIQCGAWAENKSATISKGISHTLIVNIFPKRISDELWLWFNDFKGENSEKD